MMADLKISSKKYIKKTLKNFSNLSLLTMNIDSLMIWWLKYSKEVEDLYGHAKIMMEMYKVISLLKVMDLLDS